LIVAKGLSVAIGGRTLISNLDLELGPGQRLGLLGRNGSGKSTLLRVLAGELEAAAGTIKRAMGLRVVYFRQDRASLNPNLTLRTTLAPNGDTVAFRGSKIHVMAWAKRFCFRSEQMDQSVGSLSGGEHARLLISHLMQQEADLLILDEPTNDLDIATLEVLEEAILSFPGAVAIVTHDRFLLDRVSTKLLALDGAGNAIPHADYWQWQKAQEAVIAQETRTWVRPTTNGRSGGGLTKSERRELERMEEKIQGMDAEAEAFEARMGDPKIATDTAALVELHTKAEAIRNAVEKLYVRWQELEAKAK